MFKKLCLMSGRHQALYPASDNLPPAPKNETTKQYGTMQGIALCCTSSPFAHGEQQYVNRMHCRHVVGVAWFGMCRVPGAASLTGKQALPRYSK